MGERGGVGEIVDRDEIDIVVPHRRAHDVAPNPAETIDANLDCHRALRCVPVAIPETLDCIGTSSPNSNWAPVVASKRNRVRRTVVCTYTPVETRRESAR